VSNSVSGASQSDVQGSIRLDVWIQSSRKAPDLTRRETHTHVIPLLSFGLMDRHSRDQSSR